MVKVLLITQGRNVAFLSQKGKEFIGKAQKSRDISSDWDSSGCTVMTVDVFSRYF